MISHNLPKDYEPSDLVWDKDESTLYVVSDNGRIAGLDIKGNLKGEWQLDDNFDLEGVAIVPGRLVFMMMQAWPENVHQLFDRTRRLMLLVLHA